MNHLNILHLRPKFVIFVTVALLTCASAVPLTAKEGVKIGVSLGLQLPRGAVSITTGKDRYYAHRGVYYRKGPGEKYHVVPAPRGAVVRQLPRGAVRIVINSRPYYRHDGVYYIVRAGGYEIVNSPIQPTTVIGADSTPPQEDNYESVWLNNQEYRFKNGQFFKPTSEGLVWVAAPTGAIIRDLPQDAVTVWHHEIEYFEIDDIIFRKTPDGYKVVPTPWN
jgi:hypothetical protein